VARADDRDEEGEGENEGPTRHEKGEIGKKR
jgi:hypothetical protein